MTLYSSLYRCEDCKNAINPNGVFYFVNGRTSQDADGKLPITIPVGQFGDIVNAKIWVVLTNPKGDRSDPLVGLPVNKFNVKRRKQLKDEDIQEIFRLQSNYFKNGKGHPFFSPILELLEGMKMGNHQISVYSGDVCFVDAIKCPTEKAWMGFVMTDEGKEVWDNCLRKKNKFLEKQIDFHQPKIILFYGTAGLIKAKKRGKKIKDSPIFSKKLKLTARHVHSEGEIKRISIDFSNTKYPLLSVNEKSQVKNFLIQNLNHVSL